MISRAPLERARSATRTIIGRPARSASILPGNRVDACRAGMTTENSVIAERDWKSQFLVGRELARVVLEHDGDAVLDRISEAVGFADEFLPRLEINQRPLANRAHQDIEQLGVHLTLSDFLHNQFTQRRLDYRVDAQGPPVVMRAREPFAFYRILLGHYD